MAQEIRLSTWIAAAREQVWKAVEREEYVRRWLSKGARWDGHQGGEVRIYSTPGNFEFGGTIHVWEPGRRVVFGWAALSPFQHPETRVSIELAPEGEGTRVTIVHDQFDGFTEADVDSYREGWNAVDHCGLLVAVVAEIAEGVA